MKRTDLPKRFQELLARCHYATIATVCADGQPWSTPLWVEFDDDLRMYWASWMENQHSRNIARDSRIFVTLFETNAKEGEASGLYLRMNAHVVDSVQGLREARQRYATEFGEDGSHEPFIDDCPRRLYGPIRMDRCLATLSIREGDYSRLLS